MVIRAGGRVDRLEAGGSVVGLMRTGSWEQSEAKLDPGDLLLAFTDGVSEAMTDADEEWGEERLIAAAQAMRRNPARAILDHIMRSADGFVAGAPQYDDMTLIVARLA
jgi:sigma-B regulation protein RsbU (phosphoserine phosphatase)